MKETENFCGPIAGMAMVIIGLSTITYFMRGFYEREFSCQVSLRRC
jgi:Na+-transporting methylmalonyl-CoA/oxaloacetate decarboxylase gamma subunit